MTELTGSGRVEEAWDAVEHAWAQQRAVQQRSRKPMGLVTAHTFVPFFATLQVPESAANGVAATGDAESRRMRRGKVGGFADYLTDAQAELIERTCTEWLTPAAKELLCRGGTHFSRYN